MVVILGAGLAGLSSSYHLNHNCTLFEKNEHSGGHIYSHRINGFTWDEGPHVSFTKHEYVKNLFSESVNGEFHEFPVSPTNYYKGCWVPHPAQANLFAIPEPLRTDCLNSFLQSRAELDKNAVPKNYREWLHMAFGSKFADEFPTAYTSKYWTTSPENLTTDWVGERVFYPEIKDVEAGYISAPLVSKHYITSIRYPKSGGYFSFANKIKTGANIELNKNICRIDLERKKLFLEDGSEVSYSRLINTIPLPEFIKKTNAPAAIIEAANELSCSDLLILNFVVNHSAILTNQWLYVYDTDKYSTRINFTELLSESNGKAGKCGIQVEVYFSKYKPQIEPIDDIISKVSAELVEMNLVKNKASIIEINTNRVSYANIIFDFKRREALNTLFEYLEKYGLIRESDDLEATTNWNTKMNESVKLGTLIMAGRFAQWNYYWTDDCVMRGYYISKNV